MSNKKLQNMATKDASDWARAEMFFGEGAGIRRRHLEAQIKEKRNDIPNYKEWFDFAYSRQNMAEHAIAAAKERKKIDAMASAGKNFRAIRSGNIHGLSNSVFVIGGLAYVVHATGADKKIVDETKRLYKKAKAEVKYRKARMEGRNVEKLFG